MGKGLVQWKEFGLINAQIFRQIPKSLSKMQVVSLESKSEYVFANHAGNPCLVTSLDHLHKELRADLQLPKDCVLHSLRHTFLTRFGEAGADAFTIKKVAGHSNVAISERYIHPTPEGQERVFERFANLNQTAVEKAEKDEESLQFPLQS